MAKKKSIKINPLHEGMLHEDLKVPEGKKIPVKKMEALKKSGTPAEKKRATFALNARKWKKY